MPQCRAEVTSKAAQQRALGASCRDRHAAAGQGQRRRFVNFLDGHSPSAGPAMAGKSIKLRHSRSYREDVCVTGNSPRGLAASALRSFGFVARIGCSRRPEGFKDGSWNPPSCRTPCRGGQTGKGGFLFWLVLPAAGDRPASPASILAGAAGTRRPVRCVKLAFQWHKTPAGSPSSAGLFAASDGSPSFAWQVEPAQPKSGTGPLRDVGFPEVAHQAVSFGGGQGYPTRSCALPGRRQRAGGRLLVAPGSARVL